MKGSPELADAILRLRTNTDFKVFIHSMGDYGEKLVQQMIYAPDESQLRVLQGEARAVTEILKTVQNAEKYRKNTP